MATFVSSPRSFRTLPSTVTSRPAARPGACRAQAGAKPLSNSVSSGFRRPAAPPQAYAGTRAVDAALGHQGENSSSADLTSLDGPVNLAFVGAALAAGAAALASSDLSLWELYQTNVEADPIATKAVVSGTVYFAGDLIAQAWGERRGPADWDRGRALRSGLVGFLAHGPLSHCYYLGLDWALAHWAGPAGSGLPGLLLRIGVDQTAWSLAWNGFYCAALGALRLQSPGAIRRSVADSAWPLLRAGWRLWPLAHVVTYGLLPVQHRLLFVDCVELVWVTILSLTANAGEAEAKTAAQPVVAVEEPTPAAGASLTIALPATDQKLGN